MFDYLKWRAVKEEQPPGTLVYAGREHSFTPALLHFAYDDNGLEETCLDPDGDKPDLDDGRTHFLLLSGVHNGTLILRVGEWFGMHTLLLEDVMNTTQRPHLDLQDQGIFLVLRDVAFDPEETKLQSQQICLFQTGNTVIAFQEDESTRWDGVLGRLRKGRGRMRTAGAEYLFIALLDAIIDRKYVTLSRMSVAAEDLEDRLDGRPSEDSLLELYRLKREVILLRNLTLPTRDILDKLSDPDEELLPPETMPYLHDVRGHSAQVGDAVQALHEILTGMLDVQISLQGMRMNNVMKLLTLISTIFIPLTFLAGIYGMNFRYMPELDWHYGYPVLLLFMVVVARAMIVYFKRKNWL
ncbi:MAG: magnesium/cobalt transporter CorA [Desulfovibrio sp.]